MKKKSNAFKNDSIFRFYIFLFSLFVLLSIIMIGAVMLSVSKRYYEAEVGEIFKNHTQALIGVVKPDSIEDDETITNVFEYDANHYDMRALVFDENGKVLLAHNSASSFLGCSLNAQFLPQNEINGTFYVDDLNGFFDEDLCSYIQKFYFESDTENPYYLMLYGSRDRITDFNTMLYLVYTASSMFILLFFLFVSLNLVRKIVKPMNEITDTARQYSQGDFSIRISHNDGFGEIGELSRVLNEMADSIDRNEKSRLAFIANVSHELRTPMTSIGGFVDAILSGTIPPEQQEHYLKIVSEEINRLSRLVRSMLYLSKYESNEMEINCAEFELRDLIIKTLFLFENQLNRKNVDVEGLDFEKVTLYADKDLIQQVIYNLVENAVKFIDEGGVLSFDVQRSGKNVNIAIRNTGEGIKQEDLSRIFEKFYKTDASRGKDKTGVGLGLSIVRSIIALHKGTINVSSEFGEYTQFDINIPITQKERKENKA
ncbi:MAG: HAMP domain-containing histidine kinase [Oscillospiraceae bacterium]|nr:HAMP domain-containing histidine kinase [Oscillospiraceae bacterium]